MEEKSKKNTQHLTTPGEVVTNGNLSIKKKKRTSEKVVLMGESTAVEEEAVAAELPRDPSFSTKKKKKRITNTHEPVSKDIADSQETVDQLKKEILNAETPTTFTSNLSLKENGVSTKKKKIKTIEMTESLAEDMFEESGTVEKKKKKDPSVTASLPAPAAVIPGPSPSSKKKKRKNNENVDTRVGDTAEREEYDVGSKKKMKKADATERNEAEVVADATLPAKKKRKDVKKAEGSNTATVHEPTEDGVSEVKEKKNKASVSVLATSSGEAQTVTDMNDGSPVKKKKKKKVADSVMADNSLINEAENDEAPKKKKKKDKNTAEVAVENTTKQPEGEYVVGALTSIFSGGSVLPSTPSEGVAVPIIKGETVIKPKTVKKNKKPDVDVDTENKESNTSQALLEKKKKDRVQQRENRKKEQRMSMDEKKRTIFVGNAPVSVDERSCKKIFSQYGQIESVRMRSVMPPKQTITKRVAHISHSFHEHQNSLNFYVKFKDEESVQKALTYNGTILDKHRIRVDTCTTKAEYDRKMTVFVGNLPLDVKDDELAEFFEENVGGVSFVRCIKDASTGMGKGFAFVVFKSPSSVPIALSVTGVQYQKRELRITKVMKKNKVAKVQQAWKKSGRERPKLNKEQEEKINKFKFSTKKTKDEQGPVLKKKARKAIRRKKDGKPLKSLMQ